MHSIDDLDRRILALFSAEPDVGVLGASRRLGVARGTVQARLDRLERDGRHPELGAPGRPGRARLERDGVLHPRDPAG